MPKPITIEGDHTTITIKHQHASNAFATVEHPDAQSTTITIHSDGTPFARLIATDDRGTQLFRAPDIGPGNTMWHVTIS